MILQNYKVIYNIL